MEWIWWVLWVLFSLGLVAWGFYSLKAFFWFQRHGVLTQGNLVSFYWNDGLRYPEVAFKDRRGRKILVRSNVGGNMKVGVRVGQAVRVCYDPARPKRALLGSQALNLTARLLLCLVGLAASAFSWVWFKAL